MSLQVERETHDGVTARFTVAGSLDSDTAPELDREVSEILAGPTGTLVLDLSGLRFISSAGLRVILKAEKVLGARGGKVAMLHLTPQVAKVFEIVEALPSLSIFASDQEMDDYLASIQGSVADKNAEKR